MMRDSRTEPETGGLAPERAEDRVRALGPDQLQAVVPRITTSILHDRPPGSREAPATDAADAASPGATTFDVDGAWTAITAVPLGRADLVFAGAASLAVWLVAGDVPGALVSSLLVCAAGALRRRDRRVAFSFGEGFVGYRSDPGWPRGVQEEDDVHWDWRSWAAAPEAMSPEGAAGLRD